VASWIASVVGDEDDEKLEEGRERVREMLRWVMDLFATNLMKPGSPGSASFGRIWIGPSR
jgi:hypothetical protein